MAADFQTIVNGIRNLRIGKTDKIAERLMDLEEIVKIDEKVVISIDSAISFAQFLNSVKKIRYPDITITPDGCIYVHWARRNGKSLSLKFINTSKVKYILFTDEKESSEEKSASEIYEYMHKKFGFTFDEEDFKF